jgi:hypothetical protein
MRPHPNEKTTPTPYGTHHYLPEGGGRCDFCDDTHATWVFSTRTPVEYGKAILPAPGTLQTTGLEMEDLGTVFRACDPCCELIVQRKEDELLDRCLRELRAERTFRGDEWYGHMAMPAIMIVTHFFAAGPDEPGRIAS